MRRIFLLITLFLFAEAGYSQYKVKFNLVETTAIPHDSIYVTGTFANWDSTFNPAFKMKSEGGRRYSITLDIPAGPHRYKFTRGNWLRVEKAFLGAEIEDRRVSIHRDTTFYDTVSAWRDEILSDKWQALAISNEDSSVVRSYFALAYSYVNYPEWHNLDSAYYYVTKMLLLMQKLKATAVMDQNQQLEFSRLLMYGRELSARILHGMGNFSKELELRLDNLALAEKLNDTHQAIDACGGIANAYLSMKDYQRMLNYGKKMYSYLPGHKHTDSTEVFHYALAYRNITLAFFYLNQNDSALYYARKLYDYPLPVFQVNRFTKAIAAQMLGDIYLKDGLDSLAMAYYREALLIAYENYSFESGIRARYGQAKVLYRRGLIDSAIYNARIAMNELIRLQRELQSFEVNVNEMRSEFSPFLAQLYSARKQPDSAYYYLNLSVAIKDSMFNLDKIRQFQNLTLNESLRAQQQEQDLKIARQELQSKIKVYSLIAGLVLLSVGAFFLLRNNRQQKKAKDNLEKAYSSLRSTQAQLIQSEKMASLGELTAGIAHEIQNPLNFVNNFAEVNKDLLNELKSEIAAGNFDNVKSIADDLINNEDKISHHGKRADSIVKGMLQHSRTNTSQKELTDINALADEYLRLSYHGMRAKDKTFNAEINTSFDPAIGKIKVIPQEIGRVFLNIYNNAFYAVKEKSESGEKGYQPIVSVETAKLNGTVIITVKDNGKGISENVREKIFQPFFTTKPTGQGTGLGLSLSYDIITKGHSGQLVLDTANDNSTTFKIIIPV